MSETSDVSSLPERYYVYILFSFEDKGLYIGFTTDLKSRLTSHAKGKNQATILRRPLKLIHYEYFINKADAKAREEFLESKALNHIVQSAVLYRMVRGGHGREQLKQFLKRTLVEELFKGLHL